MCCNVSMKQLYGIVLPTHCPEKMVFWATDASSKDTQDIKYFLFSSYFVCSLSIVKFWLFSAVSLATPLVYRVTYIFYELTYFMDNVPLRHAINTFCKAGCLPVLG